MTFEARLAFVLFFFFVWFAVGLIPWAVTAVIVRGRGALLGLPLALGSAAAGGLLVPLLGGTDATGFLFSLPAAFAAAGAASIGGIAIARRLEQT